jgi:hypothetical protein
LSSDLALDTDASGFGIGAVLSQATDGKEVVIAYFSKALSKAQRQYCVTRRELLAVILGGWIISKLYVLSIWSHLAICPSGFLNLSSHVNEP